jgi:hypothetical protein
MRPTICVLALSLTGILGLLAADTARAQTAGASTQPATAPASQATSQVTASGPAKTSAPSGTSRLEEISRNVKTLIVELRYYGPLHKGFYSLTLHVPDMHWLRRGQFDIDAQVAEKQAIKILDYLQDAKVLDALKEYNGTNWKMPEGPTYVVMVRYGKDPSRVLYHEIGWDDALIKFADGLRKVLDEDQARKQMDTLMRPLGSLLKADDAEEAKKTPVP